MESGRRQNRNVTMLRTIGNEVAIFVNALTQKTYGAGITRKQIEQFYREQRR